MKWVLKGGISIDADSGPPRYVLWCCGSKSQDFFTFIQIGSGHTVDNKHHFKMKRISMHIGRVLTRVIWKLKHQNSLITYLIWLVKQLIILLLGTGLSKFVKSAKNVFKMSLQGLTNWWEGYDDPCLNTADRFSSRLARFLTCNNRCQRCGGGSSGGVGGAM